MNEGLATGVEEASACQLNSWCRQRCLSKDTPAQLRMSRPMQEKASKPGGHGFSGSRHDRCFRRWQDDGTLAWRADPKEDGGWILKPEQPRWCCCTCHAHIVEDGGARLRWGKRKRVRGLPHACSAGGVHAAPSEACAAASSRTEEEGAAASSRSQAGMDGAGQVRDTQAGCPTSVEAPSVLLRLQDCMGMLKERLLGEWEAEGAQSKAFLEQLVEERGGWDVVLRPTVINLEPYPSTCVASQRKRIENGRPPKQIGVVVGHQTKTSATQSTWKATMNAVMRVDPERCDPSRGGQTTCVGWMEPVTNVPPGQGVWRHTKTGGVLPEAGVVQVHVLRLVEPVPPGLQDKMMPVRGNVVSSPNQLSQCSAQEYVCCLLLLLGLAIPADLQGQVEDAHVWRGLLASGTTPCARQAGSSHDRMQGASTQGAEHTGGASHRSSPTFTISHLGTGDQVPALRSVLHYLRSGVCALPPDARRQRDLA